MKKLLLILLCLPMIVLGQVQINTTGNFNSPSYLIDNALIGNGVITSNHSFIGDSSQIGFFSDSLNSIGMDSGFVLSTGAVDSIGNIGIIDTFWNYIWDSTWTNIIDSTPIYETYFCNTNFMTNGDPDLLTIANSVPTLIGQTFSVTSTADAVILEFDFVPSSDTVKFNYIFASEEYLDFVNSSFNDVFAFLISGPGITGPYVAPPGFPNGAINIAVVPNTLPALPITVSTVNDTTNSQYYNYDTLGTISAFNGFTDVFTAMAIVQPCETYHIKLALADGTDNSYDSGVFFEAGSFNAIEPGAPNISVNTTDVLCNGDSSGTASICVQGGTGPYTVNWNGINPNSLSAGIYSVTVTDAIGITSFTNFIINEPNAISNSIIQTILDLEVIVIGGTSPYNYQWNTNAITQSITPLTNSTYWCLVTDNNGCISDTAFFNVTNVSTPINEIKESKRTILKTINILGESTHPKRNTLLFYIYDDGTVEKRIILE